MRRFARPALKSPLVRKSLTIGSHSTTVGLEGPFWEGLEAVGKDLGVPVAQLIEVVAEALADRPAPGNLASALRVFVLGYYRQRCPASEARPKPTLKPVRA